MVKIFTRKNKSHSDSMLCYIQNPAICTDIDDDSQEY